LRKTSGGRKGSGEKKTRKWAKKWGLFALGPGNEKIPPCAGPDKKKTKSREGKKQRRGSPVEIAYVPEVKTEHCDLRRERGGAEKRKDLQKEAIEPAGGQIGGSNWGLAFTAKALKRLHWFKGRPMVHVQPEERCSGSLKPPPSRFTETQNRAEKKKKKTKKFTRPTGLAGPPKKNQAKDKGIGPGGRLEGQNTALGEADLPLRRQRREQARRKPLKGTATMGGDEGKQGRLISENNGAFAPR